MAENKTQPTYASVDEFIQTVDSPKKREEAFALKKIMEEITGEKAVMWGPSIIGFGEYHYKYASGREGDFLITGFSPRKAAHSLYLLGCMEQKFEPLFSKLGKYKMGAGCLYVNKLSDVDLEILKQLIAESHSFMKAHYPTK